MQMNEPFLPPPAWTQSAWLARVVSIDDPQQQARVQVELCAFSGSQTQDARPWARVVAPFAGDDRGCFFLPDVDDEVMVVFVQGDPRHPLVVGGLWNGASQPPAAVPPGGVNRYKRIRSRNGLVITLDDQSGQESITLETPGGCSLTISDGPGSLKLQDSNGNSIELGSASLSVQAASKVTISAPVVEVSAGMVKVDAGMSKFSGVVKCDTLITNAVVSSSYTPGAGNIW